MKILILYGSSTSSTESVSYYIFDKLKKEYEVDIFDVTVFDFTNFSNYDLALIGCPTWDIGKLQSDWEKRIADLDGLDLSNISIALFGDGDQVVYPDTFQDALGIMYKLLIKSSPKEFIGFTKADSFEFESSKALIAGKFCGLAFDSTWQEELTYTRVDSWLLDIFSRYNNPL